MNSSNSEKEQAALLDLLIPPDSGRGLPGGSQVGFEPGAAADECLKMLGDAAAEQYGKMFFELTPTEKAAITANLTRVQKIALTRLSKQLAEYYYLNPNVAHALGFGDRPPFPEGYHVEEGDLMLLEPVYLRGPMYRDI